MLLRLYYSGEEKGEREKTTEVGGGQQGELGRGIERAWEKKTQKEREKGGREMERMGEEKVGGEGKNNGEKGREKQRNEERLSFTYLDSNLDLQKPRA